MSYPPGGRKKKGNQWTFLRQHRLTAALETAMLSRHAYINST